MLTANRLTNLYNILCIVNDYCEKYGVKLSHEKTKLLRIVNEKDEASETFNPIFIDGHQINFSEEAEHVGVLRSVNGNLPHIMKRISAHRKALGATLSSGIA